MIAIDRRIPSAIVIDSKIVLYQGTLALYKADEMF